jgi:hypothetical protein
MTREQREKIGETRLLRALGVLVVANQRTLEQKISDAGPFDQRVDPHIRTVVRKRLLNEGVIGATNRSSAPWFYAANSNRIAREARIAELLAVYKPYLGLGNRIGEVLEIATYRALAMIPRADFSGRFTDLDDHDDSTSYHKDEPERHIGTRSLQGQELLDFILRTPDAGPLAIECKNVRHWMYPRRPEMKLALRKALALDAVPVLIARRIPYVTFAVLSKCGFILHQTYNQLFPAAEAELAAKARDKTLLGYGLSRMRALQNS